MPYLINIKQVSRTGASEMILSWLNRCNSVKRLDFISRRKVDYGLDHVGPHLPISRADLEQKNNPLYKRLEIEGVL